MKDLERKFELAQKEIERLNEENQQLKQQIAAFTKDNIESTSSSLLSSSNKVLLAKDHVAKVDHKKGAVHNYSTPSEKIALFRTLFRGREDVYPNRWESKTGKLGYSPACGNEWSFVCKKPQIKCSDCSHREFLPITDEVISNLALDFDKQNWKQDATAVMIATGKLIGEGFDDARLDTLFLVHPISWKGSLQQYAGRLHRSHSNKQDVQIYDYVDIQAPLLMSMYKKRIKGYRAMGYSGMEL